MGRKSGTLRAEFVELEKYLELYPITVPISDAASGSRYIPTHELEERNSMGILLKFGDVIIDNWIETDMQFDEYGDCGFTEREALNRAVAKKLRVILGLTD